MKSRGDCQNSAGGFYAPNRNRSTQRGTIPTRELPCLSKTGCGNDNPPRSDRAPLIFLKKSFRKVPERALWGIFIAVGALKTLQSQDVKEQLPIRSPLEP